MSSDDERPTHEHGAAPPVRYALWIRGRLRTTVTLGDATGGHVADLSLHGWPRKRRRLRAAADDADWTVAVRPGELTVDRDGERRMTVRGDAVELGDRRLTWPAVDGGVDRGALVDPGDGRVLLVVTAADGGSDEPVAILDVAADLPDPHAVALAACAVELITRPRGRMTDGLDPVVGFDIAIP